MNASVEAGAYHPASIQTSGTVTETLTWVPDPAIFMDLPPDKVMVDEQAGAGWQTSDDIPGAASGGRRVGIGGEIVQNETNWTGSILSKRHLHEVGAGGSITLTCGLQASVSHSGMPAPDEDPDDDFDYPWYGTTLSVGVGYFGKIHAHPYNFRLAPDLPYPLQNPVDLGRGQFSFHYLWSSTDGNRWSLSRILVDEKVTYTGDGYTDGGSFYYDFPPFKGVGGLGWKLRQPTMGRTANPPSVYPGSDLGDSFFDAHRSGGEGTEDGNEFQLPGLLTSFTVTSTQVYEFHCPDCMQPGEWKTIAGPNGGPHTIVRLFAPVFAGRSSTNQQWRYSATKHGRTAWLFLNSDGSDGDSGMD